MYLGFVFTFSDSESTGTICFMITMHDFTQMGALHYSDRTPYDWYVREQISIFFRAQQQGMWFLLARDETVIHIGIEIFYTKNSEDVINTMKKKNVFKIK